MLLPLMSRLIYMTGLPGMSYSQVSRRIAHLTGGFSTYLDAGTPLSGRSPWKQPVGEVPDAAPHAAGARAEECTDGRRSENFIQMLVFQLKCLEEDSREVLDLLRDILLKADLSDPQRIRTVIMEKRNDFSASVIPSGTHYTSLRASAAFSSVSAREEQWRGIEQFLYLASIQADDEKQIQDTAEKMEQLRRKLLHQKRVLVHASADPQFRPVLEEQLKGLIAALPAEEVSQSERQKGINPAYSGRSADAASVSGQSGIEALVSPAKVAFTSLACRSARPGTKEQVCQGLLANLLSVHHLYELIRVQGGAYGAFCSISLLEGTAVFSSYRDPQIARTLNAYRTALEQAAKGIPKEFIEQAVISAVSKEVRPLVPSEMGTLGFKRALYGITDQFRRERREYLLSITEQDLMKCAESLLQQMERTMAVILANRQLLDVESRSMPSISEHILHLPL